MLLPRNLKSFWKQSWTDRLLSVLPALVLMAVGVWAMLHFIDPAPPGHIAIATGSDDSDYARFAQSYQSILAADGITLQLNASGGAHSNLAKLRDANDDTRVAFLQDGLATPAEQAGSDSTDSTDSALSSDSDSDVSLVSLGSISYEPIWIFYRGKTTRSRLSQLAGARIAIGQSGSGTEIFARRLLNAAGITAHNARLLNLTRPEAQTQLAQGKIDAAFFIDAPDSDLIKALVRQPHLHIMSLDQADAYSRKFPYLHPLVLPHGSLDLAHNTPAHDIQLLATTTTVVVTRNLHPALIALLMKAMHKTHSAPGLLNPARTFPAVRDADFPLSAEAERYYKSGPPFLQRYLPFWLAILVDRAALVVLPLLAILVPVIRTAPTLYFWRIRRRIYRWYGELKYVETQLRAASDQQTLAALIHQVDQIEDRVTHSSLPLAFAEHAYVLKEHLELVRRKIRAAPVSPAVINEP